MLIKMFSWDVTLSSNLKLVSYSSWEYTGHLFLRCFLDSIFHFLNRIKIFWFYPAVAWETPPWNVSFFFYINWFLFFFNPVTHVTCRNARSYTSFSSVLAWKLMAPKLPSLQWLFRRFNCQRDLCPNFNKHLSYVDAALACFSPDAVMC